jgi:hypothetical protein
MTCMSRPVLWALALGVVLTLGCKKQPAPVLDSTVAAEGAAAPPSPRGPGPMPAATAGQPVVVPDTGDVNATLERLTTELRKFVVSSRSVPKNFEEFATKARLEFPPAPDGKQYKIAGQAVVLDKK